MSELRAWSSAAGRTLRGALRVERVLSEPAAIVRALLAVAAAAVIGELTGDPAAGAMLTVGAFICGIATLLAPLRHRAVNAFAVGAAFSLAALAGVYLHGTGWWFLLFLAVLAYAAGACRALGVAPGIRACLVVIGCLITADLAPSVETGLAMVRGMAAGAALTFAAQLLPPYGRRHHAQRRALAALYRSLATYARTAGSGGHPASAPFTAARAALDLLPGYARPAAAPLFGLLTEAERVRRGLVTAAVTGLPRDGIAEALTAVARTLRTGRPTPVAADARQALATWRGPAAETLRPALEEAARLAGHWLERRDPAALREAAAAYPAQHPVRAGLRRIRAETRPGGPLAAHAVRVAIGTTAGEAAGRALGGFWGHGLPGHGFWAALTTMLVLFPDYGHTFTRGWGRPLGSILGGLAAWAALLPFALPAPEEALAVASVALVACAYVTLRVSQLVVNFFITAWLVVLITGLGQAPHLVAWGRPADTVLGALVALAVFLAVPTYHHHRLPALAAAWVDAQRALLAALVTGLTETGAVRPEQLDALRTRSRRARERFEAAAAGLAHEPRSHRARWDAAALRDVQRAIAELGRCAAGLYDALPLREADAVPEAAEFAAVLDRHLAALAAATTGTEPVPADGLRAVFDETARRSGLADVTDPTAPDGVAHPRARALTLCLRTTLAAEALGAHLTPSPA